MSMSSRDVILQRIRSGLTHAAAAGFGDLREPPVPEVWPRTSPQPAAMVARFRTELEALKGEVIFCPTMTDARGQLVQLMDAAPWSRIGILGAPAGGSGLVRELTADLPAGEREARTPHATANGDSAGSHEGYRPPSLRRVEWVTPDWTSQRIGELSVGLIAADALLADTGTCVVHCSTAQERLMCYLPPACIVIARVDQLVEHLPAAWGPISKVCAAPIPAAKSCSSPGPAAPPTSKRSSSWAFMAQSG